MSRDSTKRATEEGILIGAIAEEEQRWDSVTFTFLSIQGMGSKNLFNLKKCDTFISVISWQVYNICDGRVQKFRNRAIYLFCVLPRYFFEFRDLLFSIIFLFW